MASKKGTTLNQALKTTFLWNRETKPISGEPGRALVMAPVSLQHALKKYDEKV